MHTGVYGRIMRCAERCGARCLLSPFDTRTSFDWGWIASRRLLLKPPPIDPFPYYSPCILFLSLFFFFHQHLYTCYCKPFIETKSHGPLFIVSTSMLMPLILYSRVWGRIVPDAYSKHSFKVLYLKKEGVVHAMKIDMANQHEPMDMMNGTWRVKNEINTSNRLFYL